MTARRTGDQGRLDRRLAPRPLAAHLASAMVLWSSSRTALPLLKDASLFSSELGERVRGLAAEIDALGSTSVAAALDLEIARRAKSYLAGLEAYRRHPYRRSDDARPVVWREGTTRLLDYGGDTAGPVILVVPSLINRFYVLDLLPERSFLRHLVGRGLRPLVVDWGEPGRRRTQIRLDRLCRRATGKRVRCRITAGTRADRDCRLLHGWAVRSRPRAAPP